jgi:hypothetical protein
MSQNITNGSIYINGHKLNPETGEREKVQNDWKRLRFSKDIINTLFKVFKK